MIMYKEYNTNQLSLELNLAYDIPMNHEVRLISLFVDSIPNHVLLEDKSHTGRPAFHPAMLMKMTLFAYARQVFSGRKMVQMNEEVIPMKWLSQDTYVSYKTINNFRSSKHANNLIKTAFIYFTLLMRENGMIEDEALFIDGTKLEADANLYSFTWKRAVDKYEDALNGKIYEADNIQGTEELEKLSKTESGRQKQIHYNPTWNYFKELIKEELHSEEGSRIYAKRKIDVEPVFGRLKSVFGVRRVHVRGNRAVQTEVGFLFMSMNLTKLAKNLASKTSHTQKPHSDFFILIVFKTEITVWFYLKLLFAQPLFSFGYHFSLNAGILIIPYTEIIKMKEAILWQKRILQKLIWN
ncbi:transposase [Streptococcus varani]|uniref:Transposase n=1 Tax=Streptococcus varani TaxID=1608583 RepID=A0A0E4CT05_9STRE|nr:transposase [Streptococcus varani]